MFFARISSRRFGCAGTIVRGKTLNFTGRRGMSFMAAAVPEQAQPVITTSINLHGQGIAARHRQPEDASGWRIKISDVMSEKLMASKRARPMFASKIMYVRLDSLNQDTLDFFYGPACGVPQTFQAWFAVSQLHVWMCQTRLRSAGGGGKLMLNGLIDHFTTDIELKLWASGVQNTRTQDRHIQELLSFHYGCVLAYDEGYESTDAILASSLWRNVFTMSEEIKPYQLYNVVSYVRHQMQYLHSLPLEAFMEGKIDFIYPKEMHLEPPASPSTNGSDGQQQ